VLSASECRTAGASLQRLCLEHKLAELPADRGMVAKFEGAWRRARRAEQMLGWYVASDVEEAA
jgi:hypothetical protein